MRKRIGIISLLFVLWLNLAPIRSFSQCAMCRATTESNMKKGINKVGAGLNTGILYLMSVPYLIGGVAIFFWYRNKKQIRDFFNSPPQ